MANQNEKAKNALVLHDRNGTPFLFIVKRLANEKSQNEAEILSE